MMEETENYILEEFKETGYVLILKFLLGNEEVKSLNINIPETIIYYDGKAMNQFYNVKKEIKLFNPKDGISNLEVRKFFMETDYNISNMKSDDSYEKKKMSSGIRVKRGKIFKEEKTKGSLSESRPRSVISGRSSKLRGFDEKNKGKGSVRSKSSNRSKRQVYKKENMDKIEEEEGKDVVKMNKFSRPFSFITLVDCKTPNFFRKSYLNKNIFFLTYINFRSTSNGLLLYPIRALDRKEKNSQSLENYQNGPTCNFPKRLQLQNSPG